MAYALSNEIKKLLTLDNFEGRDALLWLNAAR